MQKSQAIIGLDFEETYLDTLYPYLLRNREGYDSMRSYSLKHQRIPSLQFNPHPIAFEMPEGEAGGSDFGLYTSAEIPLNRESIVFYTLPQLHALIREKKISSVELTQLYLKRLKEHDKSLFCVISLTEDLALRQARRADSLLAAGILLGPLHGIPYGLKDLVSVEGYPTTWGAAPYQNQQIEETATVARRLEEAGAVLVAKLVSGALARGDVWFGGKTRNPWDPEQGASGSSAGSGSATSAGLVGFSIGTETLGSITGPSTRNGISGLRPTYGRVSRNGVMSLSWSMDKVGPMCRSAIGCAMVFDAIEGKDPLDQTAVDGPYRFDHQSKPETYKIGYLKKLVDQDTTESGDNLRAALAILKEKGIEPIPIELPEGFPYQVFDIILRAEAGAFFDDLVRSGEVDQMVQQNQRSRANSLRQSRFIPAVEYLQANRYRGELIEAVHEIMKELDILISPTFGGRQLMITNLTGHPVVCVPTGLDSEDHPTSISFLGNLYEEDKILEFAHFFQQISSFHLKYPPLYFPNNQ
ncbi:MAG: amidase [Bacteroidia bacterium]|nr:amidase [Bacteroidia bacterium]